jgi:hypothetical protein
LDGSRTGKHHVLLRYRIRRFRGRIFRRLLVSGSRGWKLSVEIVATIEAAVGMSPGVHLAQGVDVDVGVDLRGLHPLVPEHFLDVADVSAAAVHIGGAGMAKQVAGTGLVDAAAQKEFFDRIPQVGRGDSGAVAAEEEGGFVW